MEVLIRDLYCYECSLQFHKKYAFEVHLSVEHEKNVDIKQESNSQTLVVLEAKAKNWKNESKRRNQKQDVCLINICKDNGIYDVSKACDILLCVRIIIYLTNITVCIIFLGR